MASTTKPTIVIVPGAWHKPIHFQPLTTRLEKAGYEVHPLHLPSIGTPDKDPDTKDHAPDVELISSTIRTAADAGNDVVVVVHSAGGVTGSEGTIGLSKPEREAARKPGGVIRMVYLAAFAAPEGVSVYKATNGPSPWINIEGPLAFPSDPMWRFYHDVDEKLAQEACDHLGKHTVAAKWSEATYAAWKHIPSTYLVCEKDRAIELEVQEMMISAPGANFTVERCGSGHSPMLSMPDFTAEVVRRAAGEKI